MAHSIEADELRTLVKPDRVHKRVYTDAAIFDLEMERIFGRVWLYVAHESQLKEPGDFVRARLARHEVIVTRHGDGGIHVLHNRCAHRGVMLCRERAGNRKSLTCPYHGWSYKTDGSLEAVPHRESYPTNFDYNDKVNHLARVARVESYRGFVFASLASRGPSLRDYLGPMAGVLDNLVDRSPEGEIEIADSTFAWVYRGNWKIHQEGATDVFHAGFAHESAVEAAKKMPASTKTIDNDQARQQMLANGLGKKEWEGIELAGYPGGHAYMSGYYSKGLLAAKDEDPVRKRYRELLTARHGEAKTNDIFAMDRFNNVFYPNIALNTQLQQMRVGFPITVDKTVVVSHCFRLKGAPEEMFHRAVRFLSLTSSPASLVFSDDLEMFERCHAALAADGDAWINFQRGYGLEKQGNDGRMFSVTTELPNRVHYREWLNQMTSDAAP